MYKGGFGDMLCFLEAKGKHQSSRLPLGRMFNFQHVFVQNVSFPTNQHKASCLAGTDHVGAKGYTFHGGNSHIVRLLLLFGFGEGGGEVFVAFLCIFIGGWGGERRACALLRNGETGFGISQLQAPAPKFRSGEPRLGVDSEIVAL